MKEKLLVTGGSGFVAFHILEEAVKQSYEVYASIRKGSNISHLSHLPIHFIEMDLSNISALKTQLAQENFSYIIHSAGVTAAKNQAAYNVVNADYTYNLALVCTQLALPLKKFVFVSSLAAIGPSVGNANLAENCPPNPVTGYGRSKLLAEQMLASLKDLPLLTFRPTAVYGPRDKGIYIVLKTFSKGFEPYIGNKPQTLSFVYVKDLAKLLVDALQAKASNKTYNVSDGQGYNRYEMANLSKKILGKSTFKVHLPGIIVKSLAGILEISGNISGKVPALNREKMNELTASWVCDANAVQTELGYKPQYLLKDGLEETLHWYKEQKWL